MTQILFLYTDVGLRDSIETAVRLNGDFLVAEPMREKSDERFYNESIYSTSIDLVIVDATLTLQSGVACCRYLRTIARLEHTPILTLIRSKNAQDIAQLLDAGCDDCVSQPIIEKELAARIRALLRRHRQTAGRLTLMLNKNQREAFLNSRRLQLTPTEYDLLESLCSYPGKHVSTEDLLEQVWNYPPGGGDPALVRNHVRNLRRKLEDDPDHPRIVVCLQGRGYTVSAEVQQR